MLGGTKGVEECCGVWCALMGLVESAWILAGFGVGLAEGVLDRGATCLWPAAIGPTARHFRWACLVSSDRSV